MDGGRAGKFFRVAMGLGNINAVDAKERIPNFEYYTRLSREMKVCKEYLQKPHSYFRSLSRDDQLKLLFFEEWERRRSIEEEKKMKVDMNRSTK